MKNRLKNCKKMWKNPHFSGLHLAENTGFSGAFAPFCTILHIFFERLRSCPRVRKHDFAHFFPKKKKTDPLKKFKSLKICNIFKKV
jgi:hypothetical protein